MKAGYTKIISIFIILLIGFVLRSQKSFAQLSLITGVKYVSEEIDDRLDFKTTSIVNVEKTDFPQKHSVLIKLLNTEFMPGSENNFIRTVKRCFLRPKIVQLNNGTIFILFKGVLSSKIKITQNKHLLRLLIRKKSPETAYLENYRKGVLLVKDKKYKAGLNHLRRALRFKAGDQAAYFWAGKARFALGDWKAAIFNLKKARTEKSFRNEADRLTAFIEKKKKDRIKDRVKIKNKTAAAASVMPAKPGGSKKSPVRNKKETAAADVMTAAPPAVSKKNPVQNKKRIAAAEITPATPGGSREDRAVFQLILFFAILITLVSLPFLWIWHKRPKKVNPPFPGIQFEKKLQAFQQRQPHLTRDFKEQWNPAQREEDLAAANPGRKRMPPGPVNDAPDFFTPEEPLIRNAYSEEELVKKAKRFASRGYTYDEIAKKLGVGKGELQLAMSFAGEAVKMAQPSGMRLTFDEDD
ncbi:hypothetical protein BMS3Abin05_01854 [bacterium BMS3Abin05]|nr:hypothetical protein BMS3Abin05_01854 [bacterium BMS3Abin05]GBE28847.1 hypothetical protein BMS3Bbin03_02800 [bacterium BMS3Bbin03]HDK35268.1 hypothetical protein [Bacteroidota bacterium]